MKGSDWGQTGVRPGSDGGQTPWQFLQCRRSGILGQTPGSDPYDLGRWLRWPAPWLSRGDTPFGTWQLRLTDWFRDLGFLGKPGVETKAARDVMAHMAPAAKW